MGRGRRRARRSPARAAAALVVAGLALAAGALQGAEAGGGRRRKRRFKVDGVVAARACSWAPDPERCGWGGQGRFGSEDHLGGKKFKTLLKPLDLGR